MRMVEKSLLLQIFDPLWKEHLLTLDHLRQGIGLRAYGQRDPLNEYKSEAFGLFNSMLADLRERVTSVLMRIELRPDAAAALARAGAGAGHAPPRARHGRAGDGRRGRPRHAPRRMGTADSPRRAEAVDPNDPATWADPRATRPAPAAREEVQALPRPGLTPAT